LFGHDLGKYRAVILTSDVEWDPTVLSNEFDPQDTDLPDRDLEFGYVDPRVDDDGTTHGNPRRYHNPDDLDVLVNRCVRHAQFSHVNLRKVRSKEPDYAPLSPLLGYIPVDRVKQTLHHTEAWYHLSPTPRLPFRHLTKSAFPVANVPRLREIFCTIL
jgi:hypothetical protein